MGQSRFPGGYHRTLRLGRSPMTRYCYEGLRPDRDRRKDSRDKYAAIRRVRRQDSRDSKIFATRRHDSRKRGDRSPWRLPEKRTRSRRSRSRRSRTRRDRRAAPRDANRRSRSRSRRDRRRQENRNHRDRRDRGGRRGKDRRRGGRRGASVSVLRISSSSGYSGSSSESRSPVAKKDKKEKDNSCDSDKDEIIHFDWTRGQLLNDRYRMVKLLGDGTFGRVLLATDEQQNKNVAVKVIRDVERYQENAQIEADILKDIKRKDPTGEFSRSAIMHDSFKHLSHICLVFEPCGSSLYDFLKRNQFRGFWLQDIQTFAKQSLMSLQFIHEEMKMTHTDLKPENILLESLEEPRPSSFPRQDSWKPSASKARQSPSQYLRPVTPNIRMIDFGNATYADEHHSSVINTRQYRGPEVILGLGWDERSDIWSMGCILMELYTGELLFGTHENFEHLALMERSLEPIPSSMLMKASRAVRDKYVSIDRNGSARLAWPEKAPATSTQKHVRAQRRLHDLLATPQHASFADLVGDLLTLDPAKRPSARKALQHKFFSKNFSD